MKIPSPDELNYLRTVSAELSDSRLFPPPLDSAADIFAVVLYGWELGVTPMRMLRGLSLSKRKNKYDEVSIIWMLGADLLQSLAVAHPDCEYFTCLETTDTAAVFETKRNGSPIQVKFTYTMEMARQAGLTSNATWTQHPAAMLRARCGSALARLVYPDAVGGAHAEEEMPASSGPSTTSTSFTPSVVTHTPGEDVPASEPPPRRGPPKARPRTETDLTKGPPEPEPTPSVRNDEPPVPDEPESFIDTEAADAVDFDSAPFVPPHEGYEYPELLQKVISAFNRRAQEADHNLDFDTIDLELTRFRARETDELEARNLLAEVWAASTKAMNLAREARR